MLTVLAVPGGLDDKADRHLGVSVHYTLVTMQSIHSPVSCSLLEARNFAVKLGFGPAACLCATASFGKCCGDDSVGGDLRGITPSCCWAGKGGGVARWVAEWT